MWAADFLPAIEQVRANMSISAKCVSKTNLFTSFCKYISEGSDYHTFVQNTLIFLLNLRKFWLRLIVEVSGQSQLIRDGYSVTIQLQDNEYPVTTFCNCESTSYKLVISWLFISVIFL